MPRRSPDVLPRQDGSAPVGPGPTSSRRPERRARASCSDGLGIGAGPPDR
ncbi:MAG: hypothetical protein AVDCRST_MAG20-2691 [uncultured Acidimicrobiales bacterium]|uniref:Uncharacterized protein n=1 Tax=uncultured Acidimicrobiales bacterium TaxID=310071 RepID=A0A6J4IVS1_9ACTN|nr:MAG: hypothetical protein AVDCRST_MAG20-2691 [uncultured Acidimicrobiales bacterium]